MKKTPIKNYLILVVLLVATMILTLFLAELYKNKEKLVSSFYEYANKIDGSEFSEYTVENSDLIIYISDKYDLSKENFETKFKNKLDELNLKSKLVFIDKSEINKEFLNNLEKNYKLKIDTKKLPIIVVIVDKKVVKTVYVTSITDVDTVIEYGVFE